MMVESMASKESIITVAIIILITYTLGLSLISQAFPATQATQTLSSTGSIQIQTTANIGVYYDFGCSTPLTSLAWGTLQPGGSQAIVCYIKNEGSSALTLSMYADDWEPDNADDYLDLSWNYNGNPINPSAVVQVTFTLSVDSAIQDITNFSFDITIIGTS
jgi:hypothetical protein